MRIGKGICIPDAGVAQHTQSVLALPGVAVLRAAAERIPAASVFTVLRGKTASRFADRHARSRSESSVQTVGQHGNAAFTLWRWGVVGHNARHRQSHSPQRALH